MSAKVGLRSILHKGRDTGALAGRVAGRVRGVAAVWRATPRPPSPRQDARFAAAGAIVDVAIVPRAEYDRLPPAARGAALPAGTTDGEAARLLAPLGATPAARRDANAGGAGRAWRVRVREPWSRPAQVLRLRQYSLPSPM